MAQTTHNPKRPNRRLLLLLVIILFLLLFLCILLWNIFGSPINPPGAGPAADAGGPYVVNEGDSLVLDGSGSSGDGLTYVWAFGDGETGTGASPTHMYADGPVDLAVSLTVTDAEGRTADAETQVTVYNLPPTANAGGPYVCGLGQTIQISGECDDPGPVDAETLTCTWADFSGAMTNDPGYTCPNTPGELMLTLTATDKDGASAQDTTTVTVSESPPVTPTPDPGDPTATPEPGEDPTVTPQPGDNIAPEAAFEIYLMSKNGLKYGFDASASFDPDGEIVTYNWNFGDTYTDTGVEVVHEYAQNGNYIITLIVTDDDGAMTEVTATIP